MDLTKRYCNSDGVECTILQMVKIEPEWAANRIQAGEVAINKLGALQENGETNKSMPKLSLTFEVARKELLNRSFAKHIPEYGESMLKSFYDVIVGNKKR